MNRIVFANFLRWDFALNYLHPIISTITSPITPIMIIIFKFWSQNFRFSLPACCSNCDAPCCNASARSSNSDSFWSRSNTFSTLVFIISTTCFQCIFFGPITHGTAAITFKWIVYKKRKTKTWVIQSQNIDWHFKNIVNKWISADKCIPHRLEPVFVVIVFEPRFVVEFWVLQRFHHRFPLLLELNHHQPYNIIHNKHFNHL